MSEKYNSIVAIWQERKIGTLCDTVYEHSLTLNSSREMCHRFEIDWEHTYITLDSVPELKIGSLFSWQQQYNFLCKSLELQRLERKRNNTILSSLSINHTHQKKLFQPHKYRNIFIFLWHFQMKTKCLHISWLGAELPKFTLTWITNKSHVLEMNLY